MGQDQNFESNIIRTPNFDYIPEPGGYGKTLFNALKKNGDCITQIDGITGEKDTCSSYLQRCIRTAIKMRSKGIKKGDIVTISCYNHLNSSVPYIAALFIGAKTANMDPTITLDEAVHLLKQVQPKMVFIAPESLNLFEKAILKSEIESQIIVFGKASNYTNFSEFLEECDEEQSFRPVEITNLQETAIVIFSSGSTGLPKGICITYYSMGYYTHITDECPFDNKVILTFSSIYWIAQLATISLGISGNSPRVVLPKYDENTIWQVIAKYKVSVLLISPSQPVSAYKVRKLFNFDTSSVQLVLIGGSPIKDDYVKNFMNELLNATLMQVYGMTELIGIGTRLSPRMEHDKKKIYKTMGQPILGMSYKVVDVITEKSLGPNQPGELRMKSPLQMNGYYGIDSSDCWDTNGWFKTGDMVYYDEQYYFYYVERIQEIIFYCGRQICPGEIENILMSHPKINYAVVVGVPQAEGNCPTAIAVPKESYSESITSEEIEKYLDELLPEESKLTGGVRIVKNLPFATSGKPKRKLIRELLRDGKL